MKKCLILIIFVLICFICSCSSSDNILCSYSLSDDDCNCIIKQTALIKAERYYRIYRTDNSFEVGYDIFNSDGEIVLSGKNDRPLDINMVNYSIVDLKIGMGTGLSIHKYYSVYDNTFSQEFSYVLSTSSDKLIAYIDIPKEEPMENRKVVVQNIFDKSLFYKEYQLDFSNVDSPVIHAEFSKDGESLQLTYLSGEDETEIDESLVIR